MKIVFSRKGFDSASGGGPSPIIDGRPVSLPIPTNGAPHETYSALGLGEAVTRASRGKLGPQTACHHDPMFLDDGECLFGQCGAAQSHLANRGVGVGDVFLFFGLFREEGGDPHHRIFGFLRTESITHLATCSPGEQAALAAYRHPHALTPYGRNDAIYRGRGRTAANCDPALRLTVPGGPVSLWQVPSWLQQTGLTYHDRPDRWLAGNRLKSVGRGQEFVSDLGEHPPAHEWLERVLYSLER
ncbi:hypothetical protein [Altericroceibacterium xinjiangense]|uniref:Nmad3 family putative nucleotide modification protein n=1 Tax=Altericroceibacterium xinjiangense TaxID=762261 RepID=UPI000F7EFD05|nr:hypothetical protein [Altericroceibacterium xinjiangense]